MEAIDTRPQLGITSRIQTIAVLEEVPINPAVGKQAEDQL
jgi:hypothetical protein